MTSKAKHLLLGTALLLLSGYSAAGGGGGGPVFRNGYGTAGTSNEKSTAGSDSDVIVTGTYSGSNEYWQPPFGGMPVRIPQPTASVDAGSARLGSNDYWQPPFGGMPVRIHQPTGSAGVDSVRTSSNDQ